MEGKVNKQSQPLSGVKCVVSACHYHTEGDHCTASKIEIQSRNAHTTKETDCATFMPR